MITHASSEGFRPLAEGVHMKNLVHGDETMMVQVRLEKGSRLPRHSHPHEQTGYLIAGSLRFTIGDATHTLGAGASWNVPGAVEHEVDALEESVVLEVFSPPREDYLG